MGSEYMRNGFRLLLIGLHGTGKTESVIQIADEVGMKCKIFNCATLDPYTDLIGVPVPVKDDDGGDILKMVRPTALAEAEIVFFDELNRAPQATQNAVFEIIQFGTINGEALPNLKTCWAAINPADDGQYLVEDIDPALIDRFDAYHELKPKVSVQYMSQFIDTKIAQALSAWWNDHNRERRGKDNYVSPRRLMKIGLLYEKMGSIRAVTQALPPGGSYDTKKLQLMLQAAKTGKPLATDATVPLKGGGASSFTYDKKGLLRDKDAIVKHLEDEPNDLETQKKILGVLGNRVGVPKLLGEYAPILDVIKPSLLEGFFGGMAQSKRYQLNSKSRWGAQRFGAQHRRYHRLERAVRKTCP